MKQPISSKLIGKNGRQEVLPSRFAMAELTGGSPAQRSLGNYARLTPDAENAPDQTILTMPRKAPK